jgi:hypothetical protein
MHFRKSIACLVACLGILMMSISSFAQTPGSVDTNDAPTLLVNHARAVVSIQENRNYFFMLRWNSPFPDTHYTATCGPQASPGFQGAGQGVYLFQVSSVTPTSIRLEVAAIGSGQLVLHCLGVHD